MNIGTGQHPVTVTFCKENASSFLNSFQDFPVGQASYVLRRKQSGSIAFAVRDQMPRIFKPLTTKVRLRWNPSVVDSTQFFNVAVAWITTHEFVTSSIIIQRMTSILETTAGKGAAPIYWLMAVLLGSKPPVWRRLQNGSNYSVNLFYNPNFATALADASAS